MYNTFRKIVDKYNWPLDCVDNGMYAFTNEKEFAACFATDSTVRAICLELANKSNQKVLTRFKNFINSITNLFVNKNLFQTEKALYEQYQKTFNDYLHNKNIVTNKSEDINNILEMYSNRDKKAIETQSFLEFFEKNTKILKIYQTNALMSAQSAQNALRNHLQNISDILQTRMKALRAQRKDDTGLREKNITNTSDVLQALNNENVSVFTSISIIKNLLAPQLRKDIKSIEDRYNNGDQFTGEEYIR
mgnify:CR=1 FL=1